MLCDRIHLSRFEVLCQGLAGIIVGIVTQLAAWVQERSCLPKGHPLGSRRWNGTQMASPEAGGVRKVMATICGLILTCLPGSSKTASQRQFG